MPFDFGDLVYAKHRVNGGYHQAMIEMINQVHRSNTLVHRRHVIGYIVHHAVRHARQPLTRMEAKMKLIKQ
eukprot:8336193-Ditylum_brightwellii.AAC.1